MFRRFKGLFVLLAILCVTAIAGGSAYFYFGDQEKEKEEEIIDNSSDSGNESGGITADNILENYEFGTTKDLNEEYTYYFFPSTLYMELYDSSQNPEDVFGYNEVILDDNGNPDLDESGQPQYNIVNSGIKGVDGYSTYYDYLVGDLNDDKPEYYLYSGANSQGSYPDTSRLHEDSSGDGWDGGNKYYTYQYINDPYAINNPNIIEYYNNSLNFTDINRDRANTSIDAFAYGTMYYYFYNYTGTTNIDDSYINYLWNLNNPSQVYSKLTQVIPFNKSTEVLSPRYGDTSNSISLSFKSEAFNSFKGLTSINTDPAYFSSGNFLNKAQYRNDRFGFWTSFYDWSDPENQNAYKELTNAGDKPADRYLPIKITVNGNLTPEDMSKVIPTVSASMFDKYYWFDYTANVWTYVGKDSSNNVDFTTKTYTSAVGGFTAKDITNIFDIMQHPSKYADSNNVIRLFPVFSNGKNYDASSIADGGRDSLRADFVYTATGNKSTINNSINPLSTKLTYSSVTYTSSQGNELTLPGYSYDVNYAVLKNVDLQEGKYESITIKMAAAYGVADWGGDWFNLYSIPGSIIDEFVRVYGEGLYTFYLFIGNSASHNGTGLSISPPFPLLSGTNLISYITNNLNYSSNELKFKHLNGIVDSNGAYNKDPASSFKFIACDERPDYGVIYAYDRPIGLAVEKVTNLRLVTDIPIDDSGNQDWGSIDSNVEQGLINAQNFTIADDVYEITSDDYLDEDFNSPTGTPIDSTNPYIYIIQNADFRFVNNLYFQIRFSNKYIDGGMNVTTDYKYVVDKAKTPKYLAYKIQDQFIKFKFQDTDNNDVFIENATVTGSGGVTRDGFKLKDYNARGIYDILLVTTSDEGGKQAMNMYVNRHTNSFIKLFNGYPGTFKDEINLGETTVDDIFVRHKLPSEDADQARVGTSKLLWNGQTYLGEYLTSNSKGDEYVKNDDTKEEHLSGKSISFLEAIKNELGVTPGNDTIYPIKDAVTGRAIAYYNSGVGRLYTNEGSVFDDETNLNLFTIMKNYVLYIVNPEGFYGTWTGKVGQNTVTLVLNDDMTGSYNGRSFTYKVEGNKILGTTDDGTKITVTYIPETQEIKVYVQDPNGGSASGTLSDYKPAEGDSSETTPESSSL